MHVVIMGCGRVGARLSTSLEKRGHSVAIIDVNRNAFGKLPSTFAGRTVTGSGFDRATLVRAGIEEAQAFAAVSSGDNSNILAARVVRETFGLDNVVARIYDADRAAVYERLGIATIASVRWATDQVLRQLVPSGTEPLWRDGTGAVRLDEFPVPAWLVGTSVAELQATLETPIPFLIRFGAGIVPGKNTLLQDGDRLLVALESGRAAHIDALLTTPPQEA